MNMSEDPIKKTSNAGQFHKSLSKLSRKLVLSIFGVVIFGAVVYSSLIINSPQPLKEHIRSVHNSNEQLTIVMNTFDRQQLMQGMCD